MSMISRQAEVDGVPVRWEEDGDGLPVVLIHGIPTGPDLWRHVTSQLTGVRVLAFEMVGYGRSIPAGQHHDISVAAQAGYLNAWLDDLGVDRAVLVGHDLGGGVAQIAAVARPDRCAGLMLTNAIAYDSWPIPSVKALRATSRLFARTPDGAFKALMATLLARGHDDVQIAAESLDVHYRHYADADGAAGMARQVRALDVQDTLAVADRLPELDVPARIVWGLADRFQTAGYGERLAHDLGTRPIGIPGGKHFTPEDHPGTIADAILDLVADVQRSPDLLLQER